MPLPTKWGVTFDLVLTHWRNPFTWGHGTFVFFKKETKNSKFNFNYLEKSHLSKKIYPLKFRQTSKFVVVNIYFF